MKDNAAISRSAAEKAVWSARQRSRRGGGNWAQLRRTRAAEATCACLMEGEDAAEGCITAIDLSLIDDIELRSRERVSQQELR